MPDTDDSLPPELAERLAALRQNFIDGLEERQSRLHAAFANLKAGSLEQASACLEAIRFETHKLAGSGATFGFPEISDVAGSLEVTVRMMVEEERGPTDVDVAGLIESRDTLDGWIAAALSESAGDSGAGAEAEATEPTSPGVPAPLIGIVSTGSFAEFATNEMQAFGYRTKVLESVAAAGAASREGAIGLAIVDGDIHPGGAEGVAADIESQRGDGALSCPVVFVTEVNDLATRLAIVRAGAEAFLAKPVEAARLVDVVDGLGRPSDAEPYRVLVLDDDVGIAEFVSAVLRESGMIVETLTQPAEILEAMSNFAPELVLMDLYMPSCTGPEIASVIRQEDSFAGVPIVFLSGEQDQSKQLSAIGVGGDDFITKPIRPPFLVKAVRARAKRFRTINGRMVRDSLTGLYNHSTTMQFLSVEVQRAERASTPVAVAVADIDHFKSVNDTYGHAVGDRVIKSLARTLSVRLRGTDIIGRTGGEEFTVIMPGTPLDQAEAVLNEIRIAFSEIEHRSGAETFCKTLSIGVTAAPPYTEAHSLHERADVALYRAKRRGRNNVCILES